MLCHSTEKAKYSMFPRHMDTHIFNEALVHYYAAKHYDVYGLCPGWIVSDGLIRSLRAGPWVVSFVSLFFPTQEYYAEHVALRLFACDTLKPAMIFNQRGVQIEPNSWYVGDKAGNAQRVIDASHELVASVSRR
jgi:hypothetical protein